MKHRIYSTCEVILKKKNQTICHSKPVLWYSWYEATDWGKACVFGEGGHFLCGNYQSILGMVRCFINNQWKRMKIRGLQKDCIPANMILVEYKASKCWPENIQETWRPHCCFKSNVEKDDGEKGGNSDNTFGKNRNCIINETAGWHTKGKGRGCFISGHALKH